MKRPRASIIMEYAIILSVALAAMTTMSIYVKRGFQGKIRGLTDYFISNEQVSDSNPKSTTVRDADSLDNMVVTSEGFTGGGVKVVTKTRKSSVAVSTLIDEDRDYTASITPGDAGTVPVPQTDPDHPPP